MSPVPRLPRRVPRLPRRGVVLAAIVVAALALLAPAAQASLVQPSDCQPSALSQPFAGDPSYYEQVLGSRALSDGESVLAQPACVNVSHPTVRFFVTGDPGATVSVDALFTAGAAAVAIPVGSVAADAGVSPPLPINVVNMASLDGRNTLVTVRFSVRGGSATIGSAWVDPWRWW